MTNDEFKTLMQPFLESYKNKFKEVKQGRKAIRAIAERFAPQLLSDGTIDLWLKKAEK